MPNQTLARTVLLVVALLLLPATGCTGLANSFILFPSNHRVIATGKRWELPGSDEKPPIETYYRVLGDATAQPDLFILAFTGNAGRAELLPSRVAQTLDPQVLGGRSVGVVGMQYPGYGRTPVGNADLAEMGEFGLRAYQALHAHADGRPVYVYGISLGSTIALHVAASETEHRPAGLILDRPPELRGIIVGDNGWWNFWTLSWGVWWGVPPSSDSKRNGGLVGEVPALFLMSDQDQTVRPVHQRRVANAYVGPKKLVWASCSHNAPIDRRNAPDLDAGLRWLLDAR